MIKWFDEINEEDFQLVGGKGYNLSRMIQRHINVPNGFVVLSTVYDHYIEYNHIESKITEILNKDSDLKATSSEIKALFSLELFDESLKNEIIKAFGQIPSKKVAVRSSSTIEDLPGMSFAGQYSTYLNVNELDIINAIIKCWQSLWNERAIDYRKKNKVTRSFSHGVVIQEMVDASVSGVVFTANPISGVRHELVINSSFGLGEAIVSGEVNPDQYILDRRSKDIIYKVINQKEMKYVYGQSGIKKVELSDKESIKASLTENMLMEINDVAKVIEDYFGKPQDLEIAFSEDNELFILQSRDITTLFPITDLDMDGKLRTYMSAGTVLLGMKEPFTPMGFDVMSQMFPTIINIMTAKKKPLTNNFVKNNAERMYVDMSYLMASKFVSKQFAKALSANDLPLRGVLETVINTYGKQLTKQGIKFRMPLGFIKYGASMSSKVMKVIKIPNDKRYDAMIEVGNDLLKVQQNKYKQLDTIKSKLDFSKVALVEAFKLSQTQAMYCLDANNITKVEKILKKNFGDKYNAEKLIQSLPRCITQTMTVLLNKYAKSCAERNKNPNISDPEFIEILAKYGHRANIELDIGTKRWREDSSYLLGLVVSYLKDDMYKRNLQDYEDKKIEAQDYIVELYEAMLAKKGKKKAEKFKTLMINYRTAAGMREYPKSDIVRFIEIGRHALISAGEELVTQGKLDKAEDIFFLHQEDVLRDHNLKELVTINKAKYDKEMKRTSIPRIVMNNGATYYTSTVIHQGAKVIKGMALSPGVYEGHIKVVFDPMTTDIKEGEILVTESTNPAWTPLFATAGALIMEYGGPMSHGGIVAREYGLPAVVGIPSATLLLKDGQKVRVNGETGVIELLD